MSKMNFYTQNGWCGSNYNNKLQTKDIAKKVREFAKKNFPGFKFSVRTEWSMYTDSLYVVLKSGPCVPFVEGSKLAKRGHFETMSSVKSWEKDGLTPEVFAALDGVTSYASSFRYNDSDGMQDYFDTNFYLKIEIDDDYKVIEPKAKKTKETEKEESKAEPLEDSNIEGLEIVEYSEKAIAVFGETKEIKDQLKELGGKFNPALKYNGEKRAGWIFSKKQADKVRALLAPSSKEDEKANEPEPLIITDYKKYGISDYKSVCDEMDGFKLGEVAFDQYGEIGVILAFYDLGEVRLNSNGVCCVGNLKKCPKEIAEKELKYMAVLRPSVKDIKAESFPLEDIEFTQTNELDRVYYYDVEGADIITSAKLRADIQPGDVFNVYTDKERKYGVQYDGISPESSLYKALPGIIATNEKLEAQTFSIAPKELPANVELYEKKITGKRYIVNDKPDKFGCFHIIDTMDNAACDFCRTKEDAEKRAEYLNELTDGNGRVKKAI